MFKRSVSDIFFISLVFYSIANFLVFCFFDLSPWEKKLEKEKIHTYVPQGSEQKIVRSYEQIQAQKQHQKIILISSFKEIPKDLIHQKTLLVLDIDLTFTAPKNPLLHPKFFSQYKEIVKKLYQHISLEEKHFLNHSIIAQPSMIVEPYSVEWLQTMKKKQIPMIALTAAKPGRFDNSNRNFHEIRFEQLKKLGIDFSTSIYLDRQYTSLQPTCNDYPCIKKGIFYSCGLHNSKGAALNAFLDQITGIDTIIAIDDRLQNLDSMASMLKEKFPTMEFLGFHYNGADLLTPEIKVSKEGFEAYLSSLISEIKKIDWIKK